MKLFFDRNEEIFYLIQHNFFVVLHLIDENATVLWSNYYSVKLVLNVGHWFVTRAPPAHLMSYQWLLESLIQCVFGGIYSNDRITHTLKFTPLYDKFWVNIYGENVNIYLYFILFQSLDFGQAEAPAWRVQSNKSNPVLILKFSTYQSL